MQFHARWLAVGAEVHIHCVDTPQHLLWTWHSLYSENMSKGKKMGLKLLNGDIFKKKDCYRNWKKFFTPTQLPFALLQPQQGSCTQETTVIFVFPLLATLQESGTANWSQSWSTIEYELYCTYSGEAWKGVHVHKARGKGRKKRRRWQKEATVCCFQTMHLSAPYRNPGCSFPVLVSLKIWKLTQNFHVFIAWGHFLLS